MSKVTEEAAQLQAVMMKNPKKARHTCTKEYRSKKKTEELTQASPDAQPDPDSAAPVPDEIVAVWEISDDEGCEAG